MALVESIPQHVKYAANVTLGIPLEKVWKDLISMATDQVDVSSFYWTLTGEDINVHTASDIPVSYQLKQNETWKHTHQIFVKYVVCGKYCKSVLCRDGTS